MKSYERMCENRKVLVERLEELTGLKAYYTRIPRMAYIIGDFVVEKDGSLTVEENADMAVLKALVAENLIRADDISDDTASSADSDQDAAGSDEDTPHAEITFPMLSGRPMSIVNLVCMLSTKGELLSRATGGTFFADRCVADRMREQGFSSTGAVLDYINGLDAGQLRGIEFTGDKIVFTGFPEGDEDHIRAFTELASSMNRLALNVNKARTKENEVLNEKYSFRCWMIRLGMIGPEYKQARKILMERLKGSPAFRTKECEDRYKAHELEKREALRKMKEEQVV